MGGIADGFCDDINAVLWFKYSKEKQVHNRK